MFNFKRLKPNQIKRDLMDIESILQSSLKPVSPRPEFIESLHQGLMEDTFPQLETSGFDIKKPLLLGLVGFISMVFVVSLWVRLLLVIFTTLGMIQSSRRKENP
jgi:hypothetical protein